MLKEEIELINELGLHARAASKLVTIASKYESETRLVLSNGVGANCKSIMGLMMLAASCGTLMTLYSEGEDEPQALEAINALIQNKFGEE